MSLYLITGGAGFIGSHIADELIKHGERVRVLDNFCTGTKSAMNATLILPLKMLISCCIRQP